MSTRARITLAFYTSSMYLTSSLYEGEITQLGIYLRALFPKIKINDNAPSTVAVLVLELAANTLELFDVFIWSPVQHGLTQ